MAVLSSGVPARLGRYRILERIGAGGMGVVYLAQDERLEREVALKVLPTGAIADEAARKRLHKEALALSKLNHPNIATIHDFDTDKDIDFLVCEFVPGACLAELLMSGPLAEKEVVKLGIQLCEGLAAAHHQSVIHRDLKPANVRITPDGRLKILDFGLAKLLRPTSDQAETESVTASHAVMGTLPYIAPEQLRGQAADARSDIWAAGLVLYEMATGRHAFSAASGAQLIAAILEQTPPPPSAHNRRLTPTLEDIILKCLEKDPQNRYQAVTELAVDLRRLATSASGATARVAQPPRRTWEWKIVAAAALVLAVAALLLYFLLLRAAPPLTERDYLLVAEFTNTTGQPVFDKTLRSAMALDLSQSPYLNVVSDQQVAQELGLMGRRPDEELTPQLANEICQRKGYRGLLIGSIAAVGDDYVLSVQVQNPATSEILAADRQQVQRGAQPLILVDRAAANLRKRLGESLSSLQKFAQPLPDATTSSLDALKALALGDTKHRAGYEIEAISLYKNALELDPNFALVWARLATSYSNLGDQPDADLAWERAYALRNRVKLERERLYILAQSPDRQERRAAAELYRNTYPRDPIPWLNLSELDPDQQSERDLREVIRLDPTIAVAYSDLAGIYVIRGRMSEAVQTCREGLQHAREAPRLAQECYEIALSAQDEAAVQEVAVALKASTEGRIALDNMDRDLAFAHGQVRHAKEIDRRLQVALDETRLPNFVLAKALPFLRMQLAAGYNVVVTKMLDSYAGSAAQSPAALAALAEAGETRALERLKRQVTDQAATRYALALAAYRDGRLQAAVTLLHGTEDLQDEFVRWHRGSVYLRAGLPAEASADFQKLAAGATATTPLNPWGAFAHIGLARCYVQQRKLAEARAEYEQAFTFWQGADPDIPLLRQARAEYAALRP